MNAQNAMQDRKTSTSVIPVELELTEAQLIKAFRRLSPDRRAALLDKLETLRTPIFRAIPAHRLYDLTGVVSVGGDALAETEALYDGDGQKTRVTAYLFNNLG